MEVIRITQRKMKIMLTAPDLQHYELSLQDLPRSAEQDARMRGAFRHIFNDVEARTGFHTRGEKLFVQMFTSKCGGCEIFVTRLEAEGKHQEEAVDTHEENGLTPRELDLLQKILETDEIEGDYEPENETLLTEGGDPHVGEHRKETINLPPTGRQTRTNETALKKIFVAVESLDILLSLCHRLAHLPYTGVSRAYRDPDGERSAYILYLELPDCIFYTLPEAYAFLKEYGEVVRSKHGELFLCEHGQVLCGDHAVEILGSLHA